MQAECPYCRTAFRLTKTQLEIADGQVRCGICHEVFDAHDPEGSKSKNKDDSSTSLFEAQGKLIPDDFKIPDVYQTNFRLTNIMWVLVIMLVSVSLVVEYVWFNRSQFISDPVLKPWIMQICDLVDCELVSMRDTNQIEMLTRNIYSHPNVNDALMVSITMVNHAAFAQPHPAVQIAFSNVRGKVIAARRFTPEEYFQIDKNNLSSLEPEKPVSFGLEIQDPGKQATSYEFKFL
jgi:predicted Zn finger-like uncharacterized protein